MNPPKILTYDIKKLIGQSNKAKVYLATHTPTSREVALKVLTSHTEPLAESVTKRFLAEARVSANLEHDHIIRTHDAGRQDGLYFSSIEYLPLGSLRQHLEQVTQTEHTEPVSTTQTTSFAVEHSLSIIHQLALALSYTHARGYIHGNIKPENILFRTDDHVVLSDFAITRRNEAGAIHTEDITASDYYTAPEQAYNQLSNVLTDIYSLGVVFHEMLTGKVPSVAPSRQPDSSLHPKTPALQLAQHSEPLRTPLEKLLNSDPNKRFQSIDEFIKVIEGINKPLSLKTGGKIKSKAEIKRPQPFYKKTLSAASLTLLLMPNLGSINKEKILVIKNDSVPTLTESEITNQPTILQGSQTSIQNMHVPSLMAPVLLSSLDLHQVYVPPYRKRSHIIKDKPPRLPKQTITHSETPLTTTTEPDINCILKLAPCRNGVIDDNARQPTQAAALSTIPNNREDAKTSDINCILKLSECVE